MKKLTPMLAAVVAASVVASTQARTVDINVLGYSQNQLTQIQNLPNATGGFDAYTNIPAQFQVPRMAGFAAPGQGNGWPAELEMSIDLDTGTVNGYKMTLTGNQYFAANGLQADVRVAGRNYTPGADFAAACSVTNALDGADNILEVDCTDTSAAMLGRAVAELSSPGYLCATQNPFSTVAGAGNGCGYGWNTAGPIALVAATSPTVLIPTDAVYNPGWGGHLQHANVVDGTSVMATASSTPFGLAGSNGTFYGTGDAAQNASGLALHQTQGVRGGVKFTITHTGTDAASFAVDSVAYEHHTSIEFYNGFPATPGKAQSVSTFSFTHVVSENDAAAGSAKNVPAMGAFGLAALFGGLVAVAARLRRRVS